PVARRPDPPGRRGGPGRAPRGRGLGGRPPRGGGSRLLGAGLDRPPRAPQPGGSPGDQTAHRRAGGGRARRSGANRKRFGPSDIDRNTAGEARPLEAKVWSVGGGASGSARTSPVGTR